MTRILLTYVVPFLLPVTVYATWGLVPLGLCGAPWRRSTEVRARTLAAAAFCRSGACAWHIGGDRPAARRRGRPTLCSAHVENGQVIPGHLESPPTVGPFLAHLHVTPQPWMTSDTAARLFKALGAPAADVRFVGGCVRNTVIGRPIGDIDVGTPDIPARGHGTPRGRGHQGDSHGGIEHGTVTAVIDAQSFEITTLRRDTACGRPSRRGRIYGAIWEEDARRRDFTMNALSPAPRRHLVRRPWRCG